MNTYCRPEREQTKQRLGITTGNDTPKKKESSKPQAIGHFQDHKTPTWPTPPSHRRIYGNQTAQTNSKPPTRNTRYRLPYLTLLAQPFNVFFFFFHPMFAPPSCDFLYFSFYFCFFATVHCSSPPPPSNFPFFFLSFFPQIIQTSSAAPAITTCKCLYLHRHHLTPWAQQPWPPACMNVHHLTLSHYGLSPTPLSPNASLFVLFC